MLVIGAAAVAAILMLNAAMMYAMCVINSRINYPELF